MPLTPALALVLESAQKLSLRMIDLPLEVGPHDVKKSALRLSASAAVTFT